METGIHIGNKLNTKLTNNLSDFIATVFESGNKYHMDQETIRYALSLIDKLYAVTDITVANCTIKG